MSRARVVVALLLVGGTALMGCSGSGDDEDLGVRVTTTTTTGASGATTADPGDGTTGDPGSDASDDELFGEFEDRYRPGFELVFTDDELDCVLDVFKESALGDQSDEAINAAYADCGATGPQVQGAMLAADMMSGGVTKADATCLAQAIGAMTDDQLDSMDAAAGEQLYADCNIDPTKVGAAN